MTQDGLSLPSKCNALLKRVEAGEAPSRLYLALRDLKWYAKVREIRTEWAHFSTPFVGEVNGDAILLIRGHRRPSDKKHLEPNSQIRVLDLLAWSSAALETLDRFSDWLLNDIVVHTLPMDRTIHDVVPTATGFPELTRDGGLRTRELTVRQLLIEIGVQLDGKNR
jgi:hypothetical protein